MQHDDSATPNPATSASTNAAISDEIKIDPIATTIYNLINIYRLAVNEDFDSYREEVRIAAEKSLHALRLEGQCKYNSPDGHAATSLYLAAQYLDAETDSSALEFIDNAYSNLTGQRLFELTGAEQRRRNDETITKLAQVSAKLSADDDAQEFVKDTVRNVVGITWEDAGHPALEHFEKLARIFRNKPEHTWGAVEIGISRH